MAQLRLVAILAGVLAVSGCSGTDPTPADAPPTVFGTATDESTQGPSPAPSASTPTADTPAADESVAEEAPAAQAEAPIPPAPVVEAATIIDDGMTTSLAEFLNSGGTCHSASSPAGPTTDAALAEIRAHCYGDGVTTSLEEFFNNGGACQSGYFPMGPPTDEVLAEINAYCAQNSGYASGPAADGYVRPQPDANGYVGPSDQYYDYQGYVAPGFEYQVGSECFDPALGRCKTSGEIQMENLG